MNIAIVGRANVGKSTLFNFLSNSNRAICLDYPGLTRDRQTAEVAFNQNNHLQITDTAGVDSSNKSYHKYIKKQFQVATDEADIIFFIIDSCGLTRKKGGTTGK